MAARTKRLGVRVQEIFEIEVDPQDEAELRKDPAGHIKRILEAAGHKVNEVIGEPDDLIAAVLRGPAEARRGDWFHTVWDENDPDDVCRWHWYYY